jgi:hypothetical protein
MQFIDGPSLADLIRQLRQPAGEEPAGTVAAATEPGGKQTTLSGDRAKQGRE